MSIASHDDQSWLGMQMLASLVQRTQGPRDLEIAVVADKCSLL